MPILSPSENRSVIREDESNRVAEALDWCNEKIQEAMRGNANTVRVWTSIDYGDYDSKYQIEAALENAGYQVDSEMQVRHGLVIDISWN